MAKPTDFVQGTLDLLILKTISLEPKHGWAIARRIQQVSQQALQIQQGSLYPALHRLEQQAEATGKGIGELGSSVDGHPHTGPGGLANANFRQRPFAASIAVPPYE